MLFLWKFNIHQLHMSRPIDEEGLESRGGGESRKPKSTSSFLADLLYFPKQVPLFEMNPF